MNTTSLADSLIGGIETSGAKTKKSSWSKARDKRATQYYVYILKLNDNTHYIGHTRELRERMVEHKDGMTESTTGKNPRLGYFEILPSEQEAIEREAKLKLTEKNNHREILRIINGFNDLIREIEYDYSM